MGFNAVDLQCSPWTLRKDASEALSSKEISSTVALNSNSQNRIERYHNLKIKEVFDYVIFSDNYSVSFQARRCKKCMIRI